MRRWSDKNDEKLNKTKFWDSFLFKIQTSFFLTRARSHVSPKLEVRGSLPNTYSLTDYFLIRDIEKSRILFWLFVVQSLHCIACSMFCFCIVDIQLQHAHTKPPATTYLTWGENFWICIFLYINIRVLSSMYNALNFMTLKIIQTTPPLTVELGVATQL